MIDTDKYEGHTPAPWSLSEDYAYGLFIYAGDVRLAKMNGNAPLHTNEHGNPEDVNAQLIADAPLLLDEVKRLREALITVQQSLIWDEEDRAMDGDPITLEALVVQVEQVRSDITEMIE